MGSITQNVQVLLIIMVTLELQYIQTTTHLVKPQCLRVRFQSFLVVLLAFLDEAKDMPADVGCQVETHALLNKFKALLAFTHVRQD
jgi:hypothetical protein